MNFLMSCPSPIFLQFLVTQVSPQNSPDAVLVVHESTQSNYNIKFKIILSFSKYPNRKKFEKKKVSVTHLINIRILQNFNKESIWH